MSVDPVSPMLEGALAARELFVSLIGAGFTEWQAINIIAGMFRPDRTEENPS